jgi:hypothetical protein
MCFDDGRTAYALPGFMTHTESSGALTFVDCVPAEKCAGNNTCATTLGYTDPASTCGICEHGFYKLGGLCRPCPPGSNIGALIGYIAALLIAISFLCWVLSRGVGTSFFTIAVNFSQTLAVIAAFNIPWPDYVHSVFNALSVANLNLDILQPSCSVGAVSWLQKYFLYMMMPPAALILVVFVVYVMLPCVSLLSKHMPWGSSAMAAQDLGLGTSLPGIIKAASRKSRFEVVKVVSLSVSKMLYLMLAKETLSFFDCTRTGI